MFIEPKYKSVNSIFKSIFSLKEWHGLRTHALEQLGWNISRRAREARDYSGPIPWMVYSSIHYLDQTVPLNGNVLEIGGGGSTLWWLSRGNSVTTVETENEWASDLSKKILSTQESEKWTLKEIQTINSKNLEFAIENHKFDVIVNDGLGDRTGLIQLLTDALNPGGIIVWDNSDRVEFQESLDELKELGFGRLDFFGFGPINAYCWMTSVFSKDFSQSIKRTQNFTFISN